MRHSIKLKKAVKKLRILGYSLNQIYDETKIPKTTIRSWIRDIKLSPEQLLVLKKRTLEALQKGRIKAETVRRQERLKREEQLFSKGIKEMGKLTSKESFIAGVALYWAEGFKNRHEHRLGFCNSDPDMIRFYLRWLEKLGVKKQDIIARLTLNISYKEKSKQIEQYWSNITNIPANQFTKTFYQSSVWKKQFNTDNYYGVLRIHVKESLDLLLRMRGWITGLKANLPG